MTPQRQTLGIRDLLEAFNEDRENEAASTGVNDPWGYDRRTTSKLTYGYQGGVAYSSVGVLTRIAAGTVALANNAVNYVERTALGVVSANIVGFTASSLQMAKVLTAGGAISTVQDYRGASLLSLLAGDSTAESIAFSDDFERADTTGTLGTSSSGGAWLNLTGAAFATAGITSGRFVSPNGVCYAGYVAGARPLRIGGKFSMTAAGTTLALISSADASILLNKMVHCIFTDTGFTVTWWNGASQANAFASQSGVGYANGPLLTDGTVYEIWMTIRGNTVHIDLPDGSTWDGYDPNVSTLSGALTIWELFTGAGQRWESVAVDSTITKTVRGPATFTGGVQSTPIGNVTPASGRFTQLAAGAPASSLSPQAALHAFGPGLGTKPDTAWFESPAGHAIVRIKVSTAGFAPQLVFDESVGSATSNNQRIWSSGNALDLNFDTNGTTRLTIANTGVATWTSRVVTVLSKTSAAGFNLPHGAAPTSPIDGDVWTTTAGLFVRANGVTVGPLT